MAKNKKIYPLQHWFRSRIEVLADNQRVRNELFLIKLKISINKPK